MTKITHPDAIYQTPLGRYFPRPPKPRYPQHVFEQPDALLNLMYVPDCHLREQLNISVYKLAAKMLEQRVQKSTLGIGNIWSPEHEQYIRQVVDVDLRPLVKVLGMTIIVTTRDTVLYGSEHNLYIHLTKRNRMSNEGIRTKTINEILDRSKCMYI